jgi:nucleoid DNA-binding protein
MATATKSANKPTDKKTALTTKNTPVAKGAPAGKTAKAANAATTAKPAKAAKAPAPAKAAVPAKTPKAAKVAKAAAPKVAAPAKPVAVQKPIKTEFNKSTLISHVAEATTVEPKVVKAVFASLEATILASLHKKGLGSFTLPGLLKINVVNVPAKKKRTGIDPFTKEQRVFAAKPATVKIKTRALKKLKDAAL